MFLTEISCSSERLDFSYSYVPDGQRLDVPDGQRLGVLHGPRLDVL